MNTERKPLDRLRHHVSGAIARGEKEAITERKPVDVLAVLEHLAKRAERERITLRETNEPEEARAAVTELMETATTNNCAVEQMVTLLNDFRSAPDFDKRVDAWFREFAFAADRGREALARCGVQS